MKRLISNMKIINSVYGNGKIFLFQQIVITLFSVMMYQATSMHVYLIFIMITPCMYAYLYLKVYEPMIREVEDEITRELKYEFLSNRFNKIN